MKFQASDWYCPNLNIEFRKLTATIKEVLPINMYVLDMGDGKKRKIPVRAHCCMRMCEQGIQPQVGDRVSVEFDPKDMTYGRILDIL